MKKALTVIAAFTVITSVQAQDAFMAPLVEQSLLLGIDSADSVVVVGERGHILTSSDGTSYTQQTVPTTATLTAVTIKDNHVWAVGHDATILHSDDNGETWKIQFQHPELEKPFLDVLFFDQQHGIAIGAYGLFYRTRDGGNSWKRELHATLLNPYDQEYLDEVKQDTPEYYEEELSAILPHLNRVRLVNNTLYLVGEAGLVAKSVNHGETWERMETGYEGSFQDVKFIGHDTMMIVGLRGHVFLQKDQGEWEYVPTCLSGSLNVILPGENKTLSLLGNNGFIVQLPVTPQTAEFKPYSPRSECESTADMTTQRLKDKASIVNVTRFDGKVIAVTANGVKNLDLE